MSEIKFFSLPNLATDAVEVVEEPWNVSVPAEVLDLPKADYKKRWLNPETRHYLLSLANGQNPGYSVSVGNQAAVLYGFMADYDGILTEDLIETLKRKPQSRYLPAWWAKSQSGKLHLFWFFERPFSVAGNDHANQLLRIVSKKIKAVKWAVGYDPDSEKVTQVMDIGREWHAFAEDARIPHEELVMWDYAIFESGARSVLKTVDQIPFDLVAEEVKHRQWPHHPPVDFRPGVRCVRFWDPTADNQSGAQVTQDGIRVYTPHDGGFKSWRSLLGDDFCEKYMAVSLAPFLEDTFYCHTTDCYYRLFRTPARNERGEVTEKCRFEKRTEKMLRREMVIEGQLSDKPPKGSEVSPVAEKLDAIVKRHSVDAVVPILYRRAGAIDVPEIGMKVLNTSLVTVVKGDKTLLNFTAEDVASAPEGCPAAYRNDPTVCAWDNPFVVRKFPHIHRFLTCMFLKTQRQWDAWRREGFRLHSCGAPKPFLSDVQLLSLVSWMSHFYTNAAWKDISHHECGQALILAGIAHAGKSFFARALLGKLMGGACDADKFYLKGARFNAGIIASPVHLIDDRLGSAKQRDRLEFTEALKVVVANGMLRYEQKFGSALETIPWPGRVVILSNEDAQSLSVMPDLDMSTRDKFMMLKLGGAIYDFGNRTENEKWLDEELPFFAEFLLHWRIPGELADDRFGVRAMQNSDMAQASAENGLTQVLVEVLETCIEDARKSRDPGNPDDRWAFVGNAVGMFRWIRQIDDSLAREVIDSRTLQQCLQTLYRNGGYNLACDCGKWCVPYVLRKSVGDTRLTPHAEI